MSTTTVTPDAATLVERLTSEGLVGMRAAARMYGQSHAGKATHATTPTRHALKGTRLSDGRLIKLEAIRVGGRLLTSTAAVMRFFAVQNEPAPTSETPPAPTPRQRTRRAAKASVKLDEILN